jgi:hypothetical protein
MLRNEIVRGKRGITPESAWLFAEAFGTSPESWLNLPSHKLSRSHPMPVGAAKSNSGGTRNPEMTKIISGFLVFNLLARRR